MRILEGAVCARNGAFFLVVWAYDIEADDWDKPRCVVLLSEKGDKTFVGSDCLEKTNAFMAKNPATYCAHAGGIYDGLLLSARRPDPWQELIMSGSAALLMRDGNLRLRDTFRWWLAGLAKIGEYLNQRDDERETAGESRLRRKGEWSKWEVDRTSIHKMSDAETVLYCRQDTEILLQGINECLAYFERHKARKAWTAGSAALAMLQKLEPMSWSWLKSYRLDFDTAIACHEIVRGGRVENWARGKVSGVYAYDIKSAYPDAYANRDIPVGARKLDLGERTPGAVYKARWVWPWRDKIPPVLDLATGCGAGDCSAWIIDDELAALESYGVAVEIVDGWAPEKMLPIGQLFASELYSQKEAGSFFAKVFLNSLHGKFSESPIKEAWTSYAPDQYYLTPPVMHGEYYRYLTVQVDSEGNIPRHIQPMAAANVLGRARAKLSRFIDAVVNANGEVYYCDTDSIFCNLPPDEMPDILGREMGALAYEGGPFDATFLGPKGYYLVPAKPDKKLGVKGAMKGVPWRSLKDGIAEHNPGSSPELPRARQSRLFREARGEEGGADMRAEFYDDALICDAGAQVRREGIRSFRAGVENKNWTKSTLTRTIRPRNRGKKFRSDLGPTAWTYLTPDESGV